jgi:hypothetical protein
MSFPDDLEKVRRSGEPIVESLLTLSRDKEWMVLSFGSLDPTEGAAGRWIRKAGRLPVILLNIGNKVRSVLL